MRIARRLRIGTGLACLALGLLPAPGCQAPATLLVPSLPASSESTDAWFEPGATILTGFDPAAPGESWRRGDRVLLGIAAETPKGVRVWFLYLEIMGSGEPGPVRLTETMSFEVPDGRGGSNDRTLTYELIPVRVQLFNERAESISNSAMLMPEICLRYGLFDAMDSQIALATGGMPELGARDLAGFIALMRLPRMFQGDGAIESVLWEVVERPSIFSTIANFGGSMDLGMLPESATVSEQGPDGTPAAYRVPLVMDINKRPALSSDVVVRRADPPLGPASGLVAVDASRPSDPTRRFTIRLLAAKRGPSPEAPD